MRPHQRAATHPLPVPLGPMPLTERARARVTCSSTYTISGNRSKSIPKVPREHSALVDQWRRAAMSIPLNIAEAVGKTSEADRNNRYAIARGEAMECGAIIDVLRLIEAVPEPELTAAKQLLVRGVGMLSKMCRRTWTCTCHVHVHDRP